MIKTATGVKRFKTIKIREFGLITYSNWSRLVIHACRPGLATEPLMNVLLTDCNDGVNSEDQDLDKNRPSKQKFVPVKTAPKKRKRKGDNTEILTEGVNLLKMAVENNASKDI